MKIIYTIIIVLLFSGCSSGGKIVDKTYYRFPVAANKPVTKNFIIQRPTAMGILGNRPMVAQDSNGGLIQMSHNLWLDSPKVLLQNYLGKTFVNDNNEQSGTLNSLILNLEKKGLNSVLAIKFTLYDHQNNQLFSHTYRQEQALTQNDIPTFVKSISYSLEKIIQQLINDLS